MVIAGRKKGSGGRIAEAILGERHPMRIRGGVERWQGWPRQPQGSPRQPWMLCLTSGSYGRQP